MLSSTLHVQNLGYSRPLPTCPWPHPLYLAFGIQDPIASECSSCRPILTHVISVYVTRALMPLHWLDVMHDGIPCRMEQAASDELRAQGNEKYTSLHDGLAPLIYASRLQASIELYQRVSIPLT